MGPHCHRQVAAPWKQELLDHFEAARKTLGRDQARYLELERWLVELVFAWITKPMCANRGAAGPGDAEDIHHRWVMTHLRKLVESTEVYTSSRLASVIRVAVRNKIADHYRRKYRGTQPLRDYVRDKLKVRKKGRGINAELRPLGYERKGRWVGRIGETKSGDMARLDFPKLREDGKVPDRPRPKERNLVGLTHATLAEFLVAAVKQAGGRLEASRLAAILAEQWGEANGPQESVDAQESVVPAPGNEPDELDPESALALEQSIRLLPRREREVFRARRSGFSYLEIAASDRLGPLTVEQVKDAECAAVAMIKRHLEAP